MEIVFLFAGVPLFAVGVLIVVWELRGRAGAVPVPATIVGYSTADRDGFYQSVAEYVGLDGMRRWVESSVGSSAPLGSVGDKVTVLLKEGEPDRAILKSPLSYAMGAVIAAMGLGSCAMFFATFHATRTSLAGAGVVSVLTAYKLLGAKRSKGFSLQEWQAKRQALRGRVYTDATKNEIRWADREAIGAAAAKQQKTNRFAIPILIAAGVGAMVLGAHLYRTTNVFLAKALPATGRVVDLVANHSSNSWTYAPVVEFEAEGRKYRFKDSVSSNPPSYRPGDVVKVLYDPDGPRNARIDRGRWNLAIPLLVSAVGALLCSLGVWSASRRRSAGAS
jgi:Protein of unknown function (DUF3592)